jgi:predicted ATPase
LFELLKTRSKTNYMHRTYVFHWEGESMDLLDLAPADIREALRRLRKRNRVGVPLLDSHLVGLQLREMGYPDTVQHRWWALGAALDRVILDQIKELLGTENTFSPEALRRSVADDRRRLLLEQVRRDPRRDLAMWSALYCQFILPAPAAADLPDLAGVHRRTWQRWLSEGYEALLQNIQALERQVDIPAPPPLEPSPDPVDARPAELPVMRNSLIGRSAEIAAVTQLLTHDDVGLVTLTGPGGVGKTQLALAAAEASRTIFGGKVTLITLSHLSEPCSVLGSIAQQIGAEAPDPDTLMANLVATLSGQRQLLVLDGFEHVLAAGPELALLASRCPSLMVLITSREVLHVYGEHVMAVAPLAVPAPLDLHPSAPVPDGAEWCRRFPAIELFAERAREMSPDLSLTGDTLKAIGEICARLDGIPLAIELAARQLDVYSPHALAKQMARPLDLLVEGPRNRPADQQSLLLSIASCYDRLNAVERTVFQRLAVFPGGFTHDTATNVCQAAGGVVAADYVAVLRSLINKSLVHIVAGVDKHMLRFGMLGTLREFGLDQLARAGDDRITRQAHASAFCFLVERAGGSRFYDADEAAWLARVDVEYHNVQGALQWCLGGGAPDLGLRLAASLGDYWYLRGNAVEANEWLRRALEAQGPVPADPRLHLRVLSAAGRFLAMSGQHAEARRIQEDCILAAQAVGDTRQVAVAHGNLGVSAMQTGEYRAAEDHLTQALAGFEAVGDASAAARSLLNLAITAAYAEDLPTSQAWASRALAAYEAAGDSVGVGRVLDVLAWNAAAVGERQSAVDLYHQALAIGRESGVLPNLIPPLIGLGIIACIQGDLAAAAIYLREGINVCQATGQEAVIAEPLSVIGAASAAPLTRFSDAVTDPAVDASAERDPAASDGFQAQPPTDQMQAATRLLAAAQAILDRTNHVQHPRDRRRLDRNLAALRVTLPPPLFAAAWVQGRNLSTDAAVADAVAAIENLAASSNEGGRA